MECKSHLCLLSGSLPNPNRRPSIKKIQRVVRIRTATQKYYVNGPYRITEGPNSPSECSVQSALVNYLRETMHEFTNFCLNPESDFLPEKILWVLSKGKKLDILSTMSLDTLRTQHIEGFVLCEEPGGVDNGHVHIDSLYTIPDSALEVRKIRLFLEVCRWTRNRATWEPTSLTLTPLNSDVRILFEIALASGYDLHLDDVATPDHANGTVVTHFRQ